jgi:hypothetical protein
LRVRLIRSRTVAGLPAASTGLRQRPSLRCLCSHRRSRYRSVMVTSAIAGIATKIQSLMLREVRAIPPSARTTVAANSERPSRRTSSAPWPRGRIRGGPGPPTAGAHDLLTASAPSTSTWVPKARIPHFSCQLAASLAPKKSPIAATTKAVATVSLMITARLYRCSQSIAGCPIAPFARRPRADGKGPTIPPCRTENPPRSQWFDVVVAHCSAPAGGPRPPLCSFLPEARTPLFPLGKSAPPALDVPPVSDLREQPTLATPDSRVLPAS